MTKIEIEAEVFGDWAFPGEGSLVPFYKGKALHMSPQRTLFLLTLARSGGTMRTAEIVARVSPGADVKLGHVLACHIRKLLAQYEIEPPFDNMYDRHETFGLTKREIKRKVLSGYKWIG